MSDNSQLEALKRAVRAVLAEEQQPSGERIRQVIRTARGFNPGLTDQQAEEIAKEFESIHGVRMEIGSFLKKDFVPWLEQAREKIVPFYWDRYREYLSQHNFSGQVLATLDEVTDRILGFLENPMKGTLWNRRGMVVGHVQSGKTANYIGLINKAADAGYKIIIVIAGIHNNLRSQTQTRIDEGFVGFDSSRALRPNGGHIVGVGKYDNDPRKRPYNFTDTFRDFNKETARVGVSVANSPVPVVFVIKKNTGTLEHLIGWLKAHNVRNNISKIDEPMLLIDDEADNASINIKKGIDGVSKINGQIRSLLGMFNRSCYVGYTATPFANIFIDPDSDDEMCGEDLFPKDFIISLDPPDNYMGADKIFIEDADKHVRFIEDNDDLLPRIHSIDYEIVGLPESLKTAIRCFIITRAIRIVRGQINEHHSMLVNVSQFVDVQSQLRNYIHNFVKDIERSVKINGNIAISEMKDAEITALYDVFCDEFRSSCGVQWRKVQQQLIKSVSAIKAIEINGDSPHSLNYNEYENSGLSVIAVGGYSLSRGLTLEGLTISYFLRNSMMYDTLMQMGRWFGYRRGYEDLCRVWMPEEAAGWYEHISESIEELKEDFRQMARINATPEEFGLKVRSHPDTLIVTARNKMGSSRQHTLSIGLANHFIETAILRGDKTSLNLNRQASVELANQLEELGMAPKDGNRIKGKGTSRVIYGVPVEVVLNFLARFQNHRHSFSTESDQVREYIKAREDDELKNWDILFVGVANVANRQDSLIDNSFGFELVCQRRALGRKSDQSTLYITNKQRVASRGVEKIGLDDDQIKKVEDGYRKKKMHEIRDNKAINFPDRIYRAVRKRPLLIIHMLAIGKKDSRPQISKPVVAWSISFPTTELEEKKVQYVVNTTWFKERHKEEDEDELEGDEE